MKANHLECSPGYTNFITLCFFALFRTRKGVTKPRYSYDPQKFCYNSFSVTVNVYLIILYCSPVYHP